MHVQHFETFAYSDLFYFFFFFQELTLLPNLEMLDLSGNRLVSHVPTEGMYVFVAAKGVICR